MPSLLLILLTLQLSKVFACESVQEGVRADQYLLASVTANWHTQETEEENLPVMSFCLHEITCASSDLMIDLYCLSLGMLRIP